MTFRHSMHRRLRLPGRLALLLGLGALLSTAGARADMAEHGKQTAFGDLLIRSKGGKLYLSEGGKPFEQLQLSDTPEARRLKQLVEQRGKALDADHLRLNPTILAGGGGAGIHWWGPAGKPDQQEKTGTPDNGKTPKEADKPRDKDNNGAGKKG